MPWNFSRPNDYDLELDSILRKVKEYQKPVERAKQDLTLTAAPVPMLVALPTPVHPPHCTSDNNHNDDDDDDIRNVICFTRSRLRKRRKDMRHTLPGPVRKKVATAEVVTGDT